MPERDDDLSPTLAETARRRADLRDALVDVEQASSRAAGREPEWTKEVLLRLESLAHAIDEHIQITEQTEGLYDEISAKAPHLATKIDALRDEHPVLRERATALITRLQTTRSDPRPLRGPTTSSGCSVRSCAIASSDRSGLGGLQPRHRRDRAAPAPSRLRLVRIALAQVDTTVGDLTGNVDLLTAWASRATEADADVVVFPELAITGYPPEDLVLRPSFVEDNLTALDTLAAKTTGGTSIVVGFVDRTERGIHNAAGVIANGQVIARSQDQAPELRRVRRGADVHAGRRRVPDPARRLRARAVGLRGRLDAGPPFDEYARRKTPVILNINGSPFHRGKADERVEICRERALETGSWIVYVNAVGGQDELVFDGGRWSFGRTDRSHTTPRCSRRTSSSSTSTARSRARRNGRRGPRIPSRCTSASSSGCRTTSARTASRRSSSACRADRLDVRRRPRRGRARRGRGPCARDALPLLLLREPRGRGRWPPGSGSGSTCSRSGTCSPPTWTPFAERSGRQDRGRRGEPAGADPRQPADGDLEPLRLHGPGHRQQERVRGRLRDVVRRHGWGSRRSRTSRRRSYELARWRNARGAAEPPPIPRRVLDKPPSAELRPDQKDTDTLPPYEVLDPIVEACVEDDRAPEDIIAERGLDPKLVDRVVEMIDRAEYKRRQAAPGIKITPKAFGRTGACRSRTATGVSAARRLRRVGAVAQPGQSRGF